jgi:hypothetical protein
MTKQVGEWSGRLGMSLVAVLACLLAILVGCSSPNSVYHRNSRVNLSPPPLQIEPGLRQRNYGPSCSHAATQNILARRGLWPIIRHWRNHHGGGAVVTNIDRIAKQYGLDVIQTTSGDVAFLVACHKQGLCAGLHFFPYHSVTFVRFSRDFKHVVVQEVNNPREIEVPTASFVRRWNYWGRKYGFKGGVAWTLDPQTHPIRPLMFPCAER